jgi:hypothetical protein
VAGTNPSESKAALTPGETIEQVEAQVVEISERDIVFECPHCRGELVVDLDGAGLQLACTLCGGEVTIPPYKGPSLQYLQAVTAKLTEAIREQRQSPSTRFNFEGEAAEALAARRKELERNLRESEALAAEIRSQIHHATIQLHRHRLRLEMLQQKRNELERELEAITRKEGKQ